MNILVIGGTRFFGKLLVEKLIDEGHAVTVGTRGKTSDRFGTAIERIAFDRTDEPSVRRALAGKRYDTVFDNIAYASNDVRRLLDVIEADRYILTSSAAVYTKRATVSEDDWDPTAIPVQWGERADFSYEQGKREAEHALVQTYGRIPSVAVRFPYVIGEGDYTKRLLFYVEHAVRGIPLHVDNEFSPIGFISADEAARFLAFLATAECSGCVNAASNGNVSPHEIFERIAERTDRRPVFDKQGEPAPYNGDPPYDIDTSKAQRLGFAFAPTKEHLLPLIDAYIDEVI